MKAKTSPSASLKALRRTVRELELMVGGQGAALRTVTEACVHAHERIRKLEALRSDGTVTQITLEKTEHV